MSDAGPWTLERVAAARPELTPLVALHAALAVAAEQFVQEHADARPRLAGAPAVSWMLGIPLVVAAEAASLRASVVPLFAHMQGALAARFPETAAALAEIGAATSQPHFPWDDRLRRFREEPPPDLVPHPELFRFLLLRAVGVAAAHLAATTSAPLPDRWKRAACPWCGIAPAAAVARPGEGRTHLCVLCGGRWESAEAACAFCGEERPDRHLVLASREAGPASLEACTTCRTAVKVFADADLAPGPPTACEILTVHLDVVADRDHGVRRDATAVASVFPPD